MNKHSDDSTGGDATTQPTIYLDDVWQMPSGRLIDIIATDPDLEVCDVFEEDGIPDHGFDAATSRLLYRDGVFVGDKPEYQPAAALIRFPSKPPTPKKPRILLVGARRFCRIGERPYAYAWDWAAMQRVRSIDAVQTPTAYKRLRDVGLQWDYAVDLLPPGDAWGADDDEKATLSAAYLRGVAAALAVDYTVPLGGKVCKAFRAADDRVLDFEVGEEQHGYVPLPSPHARESTWWADGEQMGRLRGVVAGLVGGGR